MKYLRIALGEARYLADKFAGHSFQIGATTTAGRCGIQESLIKTLGRWESAAYLCYMRTSLEALQSVAKILVSSLRDLE